MCSNTSSVILVCISPVTSDVDHLSPAKCHLYVLFSERFLSFTHFLLCCFLLLSFECSLYILNTSLLSELWFANIFSDGLLKSKIFNFGEA